LLDTCLGLLVTPERPALDEPRRAPLWKGDVDDIEVPGNDRLGEDRACLARDLGPEVPVGQVCEDEHPGLGGGGQLGRLCCRRMTGLLRPLPFLLGEGRVVHEDVRLAGHLEDGRGSARVPRQHDFAPRPRLS
jgi:hypothetical protein